MSTLVVDVVFRGRVLESVPFRGPTLRVGRMPENDVVLDNLGVSRFHARLLLEEDRVYLEDAGSENGCLVNGERISERRAIALGDAIAIGKHELRVRRAVEGESPETRPARRKGDAWDGARTYVLDARSRTHPGEPPVEKPESKEPVVMAPVTSKSSAPVQIPVESTDLDGPQEIDFDFVGSLGDGEDGVPTAVVPIEESAAPAPQAAPAPLHAGFIVQRQGKLERVVPWKGDVLVAGRSGDCDIHLAQDEVSRRHVRFERAGDAYHVVDLGSVNGTFVNGKRVERHALEVGDIVQVEGFQLTFVLDRDPLDGAVAAKPLPTPKPALREDPMAMTMLQEEMPHRPGFTEITAKPAPIEEPTTAAVTAIAEADLLPDDIEEIEATIDDEKPADQAPLRGNSRASSVQDLLRTSQPNLGAPELKLELRIRMDLLPPALRQALEEAGATDLVLPAELHLKR